MLRSVTVFSVLLLALLVIPDADCFNTGFRWPGKDVSRGHDNRAPERVRKEAGSGKDCVDEAPMVDNGKRTCRDGKKFLSMCFYECNEGFKIPDTQASVIFCDSLGWVGTPPRCVTEKN